ncbi:MAG: HAMP domain-containing protein [Candidatus Latescibacteria bacterium]|nr:HAMP domain-containing protein [Candidatus Latescibacterota bacterium]
MVLVLVGSTTLIVLVLAAVLQRVISRPILTLAQTARQVSKRPDYTIRVQVEGRDELGSLFASFNEMLEQIQERDLALQHARDGLELRVAERTSELLSAKEQAEAANRSWSVLTLLAICLLGALPGLAAAADSNGKQVMEELLDLSLEELLQVKISTAAKYEQLGADAPASVTVVTAEDIALYGYRNLAEILRHAAGFYSSDDRNYTYLGVRGFSRPSDYNNRVLFLVDGHALNESVFGQGLFANETPFDMDSIQQVEIVRGPGSALYGSYAMFAVVNVVTRRGGAQPETHLEVEAGSWGKREASASYSRRLTGGEQLDFSGRWGEVAGQDYSFPEYADPDTGSAYSRIHDQERYRNFFARLDYHRLTVQALHSWRHKASPPARTKPYWATRGPGHGTATASSRPTSPSPWERPGAWCCAPMWTTARTRAVMCTRICWS